MEFFLHRIQTNLQQFLRSRDIYGGIQAARERVFQFFEGVWTIGFTTELDDYEKRKLGIFNQLNFFQLITGIVVPAIAVLSSKNLPGSVAYLAILPSLISILVLVLNSLRQYQAALLCYFILYPVFTCVIYINGLNLGIELSFILYGILSVFFLQDIGYMLFAIGLSMVSYFVLSITWKDYRYQLEAYNYTGYLVNHALAIVYIFYALYLIKRENTGYQFSIVNKNTELNKKNIEIEEHRKEISQKARLLQRQTSELNDLNKVKDKLFSIISHDLKGPMYALQNLFFNAKRQDLPAEEIKAMIPDVVNDLNFTTSLIENLLQWAKSQMQADFILAQMIDVSKLVNETVQHLHLQAEGKKIRVDTKTDLPVCAWADKNMISLVIRNLLANAIKFTPESGQITVGTYESPSCVEVYVQDSGTGISREVLNKIAGNKFYSSNGTNNENGTGLGLVLCKEFLVKNGGRLMIESEIGKGSTFSFTLPLAK
jgi:two-component system, sensor histidine kinase and response regulator